MERLPDDTLIIIIKKVASSGVRNFFRFRATFVCLQRLAKNNEVLRALPRKCLLYISDCQPFVEKQAFIQQISRSRHTTCSVALASRLFQQRNPDLKEINCFCMKRPFTGPTGGSTS